MIQAKRVWVLNLVLIHIKLSLPDKDMQNVFLGQEKILKTVIDRHISIS